MRRLLRGLLVASLSLLPSPASSSSSPTRLALLCMSSSSSSASPSALFFATPLKAVVGASADRDKYGNMVLRCYKEHKMAAVPINKRSTEIEGVATVASLTLLSQSTSHTMGEVGVSIITPPGVTKLILEEGSKLGIRHFYLQPGTYDDVTDAYMASELAGKGVNIVKGCVLVELGFSDRR